METGSFTEKFSGRILFEDNHLLIVNKKPGEIVQGDKTGDEPLNDQLKKYIAEKYQKPGNVFLGTVHRIDRPVSGIVIFARTGKALERMNEMLREKKIRKTYWAVVKQKPSPVKGKWEAWLKKNEAKNKSFVVNDGRQGALFSELEYGLIASSENYHLLKLNPLTGRHHQIRVMLAHAGCPIKGDLKYGAGRSNKDGSIHLHAREIFFIHPVKETDVHVTAPCPDEPLWNYFSSVISETPV